MNKLNFGKIIGNQNRLFGSLIQVTLPDLGEGTKEATVKEWYVKPGSRVQEVSALVFKIFGFEVRWLGWSVHR